MDINVVCCNDNSRKDQITKAINILNCVQSYFFYRVVFVDQDVCEDEEIDWNLFQENQGKTIDEYTIFISEKPFVDNWFSHEDYKYAIISTYSIPFLSEFFKDIHERFSGFLLFCSRVCIRGNGRWIVGNREPPPR